MSEIKTQGNFMAHGPGGERQAAFAVESDRQLFEAALEIKERNRRYRPCYPLLREADTERYFYDAELGAYYPLVAWFDVCLGALLPPLERQCRGQYYVIGTVIDDPNVAIVRCAKCGKLTRFAWGLWERNQRDPAEHDWEVGETGTFPVIPQQAEGLLRSL